MFDHFHVLKHILVKEIEAKERGTIINKQHFHLYLPWII
jgi:hypothetical protein